MTYTNMIRAYADLKTLETQLDYNKELSEQLGDIAAVILEFLGECVND